MEIVYALSEHLRFVISFDSEAQSGMQSPETLLQTLIDVLNHLSIQTDPISLAMRVTLEPHLRPSGTIISAYGGCYVRLTRRFQYDLSHASTHQTELCCLSGGLVSCVNCLGRVAVGVFEKVRGFA